MNSKHFKKISTKSDWIDVTIPIRNDMVKWPTDESTEVRIIKDVNKGDLVTTTRLNILSHAGTHIDAPLHFIPEGAAINTMPLETAIGPARLIEIKDKYAVKPGELMEHNIQKGERILFKTSNSDRVYLSNDFAEEYVYIMPEAAEFLAKKGIRVVGLDYISIGNYKLLSQNIEAHEILQRHQIWIIEGLNFIGVKPGNYELICLPIKLENGDAGLARAILRSL